MDFWFEESIKIVLFSWRNLTNELFDEEKNNMLLLFKLKQSEDWGIVLIDHCVPDGLKGKREFLSQPEPINHQRIGIIFFFFTSLIVQSHSFTRRLATPTRDWFVVWIKKNKKKTQRGQITNRACHPKIWSKTY